MSRTLAELAEALGARVQGDGGVRVERVSSLAGGSPATLAFMVSGAHLDELRHTQAGAVVLSEKWVGDCPVPALIVANPHAAFARAAAMLHPEQAPAPGIHESAVVASEARIADGVCIGPQAVVGAGCSIGRDAVIGPGCVLMPGAEVGAGTRLVAQVFVGRDCRLGERCLIHPGVVIGADGFGLAKDDGRWIKVPQVGRVVIGNDVDIGANTTVDRGAIEDTVLGDGVKLDNQIQVAHNVRIGEHTAIAGCVGIAGSAVIGSGCTIGGGAGIAGHLELADGVHVTGMTLVASDLKQAGAYSSSLPAQPMRQWQKNAARLRHLDEMARKLKQLEAEVARLRASSGQSDELDQS
ncbi:UDP-3-O-(3-hydroxymyristoyl)glucosamine N-acyltransferase [Acidihalobacter prosperus]